MIEELNKVFSEEITTNKYTTLTVASLIADSESFDAWVRTFLDSLVEEKKLKVDYEDKASKVEI
jgi:hypothetical protein